MKYFLKFSFNMWHLEHFTWKGNPRRGNLYGYSNLNFGVWYRLDFLLKILYISQFLKIIRFYFITLLRFLPYKGRKMALKFISRTFGTPDTYYGYRETFVLRISLQLFWPHIYSMYMYTYPVFLVSQVWARPIVRFL